MELYEQILAQAIAEAVIPALQINCDRLIEMKCCQTLLQIYDIVSDDTLDDPECFIRIERIVYALEDLGIGGGGRHDY